MSYLIFAVMIGAAAWWIVFVLHIEPKRYREKLRNDLEDSMTANGVPLEAVRRFMELYDENRSKR